MKDLLAKLLGMFKQVDPQKPVEPWPFPAEKECCGGCNKPAKQPAKKTKSLPVKKQKAKNTEKKPATKKVKK